MNTPNILALDFDGVICDGRREYFQSGWRTYCQIWNPPSTNPPDGLRERYLHLTPVIETDLDVSLLVRALMLDIPSDKILQDWDALVPQLLSQDNLTATVVNAEFTRLRDQWITEDFDNWLAHQPLYPGVAERLQQILASPVKLVIVTNRVQRFALQLLHEEGVILPESQVFGKQGDRPKYQVLRELLVSEQSTIWFVEDHIRALRLVEEQSDLAVINLFLADWGFNTPAVRASIQSDSRIRLLSLTQFTQDFTTWV